MKILVIGSGGREHALAWKIAASPLVTKLWCLPGNAGIAKDAECVPIDMADHPAVIAFCKKNAVDFVVVGPDAAIAAGAIILLAFPEYTLETTINKSKLNITAIKNTFIVKLILLFCKITTNGRWYPTPTIARRRKILSNPKWRANSPGRNWKL